MGMAMGMGIYNSNRYRFKERDKKLKPLDILYTRAKLTRNKKLMTELDKKIKQVYEEYAYLDIQQCLSRMDY